MLTAVPTAFDPADSVLFLGSGFSRHAKNIRNTNVPTSRELKSELAKMVRVLPQDYPLQTLADEVASREDLNLYQTLYELFTVTSLTTYQHNLLRLPWRRIYTTNYDDAVEFAHLQSKNAAPSFTYTDSKPPRLKAGSIIHLHGAIRWATEENILQQLVLNEESYVRQHFEKSPWHEELERDRRFCDAFFFVGYSLSDYHISALLLQDPTSRDRTYFVNGRRGDSVFSNRVAQYGRVIAMQAEEFSQLCYRLPKPGSVANTSTLKAFRYLDPFMDKKTLAPPTPVEILNLVTYGTFNYHRFLSAVSSSSYVVPRQQTVDDAVRRLEHAPSLLIHSRLGNGKSIFLYSLAYKLSEIGYSCFLCRPTPMLLQRDLDVLKKLRRIALFFDSHHSAIDLMDRLRELPARTRFIVAARSSTLDLRRHVFQRIFAAPLASLNLDRIDEEDKTAFKRILDRSGVRVQDLEQVIRQSRNFREIVTTLYDNTVISKKIQQELGPLLEDRDSRNVLVATHLFKFIGEEATPSVLRDVTGSDPYSVMIRFPGFARDILGLDDPDLESKSALFSEYIIQRHVKTQDVTDCAYLILVAAVKRKTNPRYQAVLSKLMRYSELSRALHRDPHRSDALAKLFAELSRDDTVNREPLFWLQYAILMRDREELLLAEGFIRTAYARAKDIPAFQTYQIDTYALKLLMLVEQEIGDPECVQRFAQILDKVERVGYMISDENHVLHAVAAVGGIEAFLSRRLGALSLTERRTLSHQLRAVAGELGQLSSSDQERTESEKVRASLDRADALLIGGDDET